MKNERRKARALDRAIESAERKLNRHGLTDPRVSLAVDPEGVAVLEAFGIVMRYDLTWTPIAGRA